MSETSKRAPVWAWVTLAALAALVAVSAAMQMPTSKISVENAKKIRPGMTAAEVDLIFGLDRKEGESKGKSFPPSTPDFAGFMGGVRRIFGYEKQPYWTHWERDGLRIEVEFDKNDRVVKTVIIRFKRDAWLEANR